MALADRDGIVDLDAVVRKILTIAQNSRRTIGDQRKREERGERVLQGATLPGGVTVIDPDRRAFVRARTCWAVAETLEIWIRQSRDAAGVGRGAADIRQQFRNDWVRC